MERARGSTRAADKLVEWLTQENSRLWRLVVTLAMVVAVLLIALHAPEGVVGLLLHLFANER